jgi:hypothetical protein
VDKLGEKSILQQFQLGIKDALDTHANRLEEQPEVQTSWEIIKKSVLKVADNMIKQPLGVKQSSGLIKNVQTSLNCAMMLDWKCFNTQLSQMRSYMLKR